MAYRRRQQQNPSGNLSYDDDEDDSVRSNSYSSSTSIAAKAIRASSAARRDSSLFYTLACASFLELWARLVGILQPNDSIVYLWIWNFMLGREQRTNKKKERIRTSFCRLAVIVFYLSVVLGLL
ncbi:hypothetical protein M5689_019582 [Euphorbia peplus]|nr:hypothetical protein M5689_019582 [Euphorbia peplus]